MFCRCLRRFNEHHSPMGRLSKDRSRPLLGLNTQELHFEGCRAQKVVLPPGLLRVVVRPATFTNILVEPSVKSMRRLRSVCPWTGRERKWPDTADMPSTSWPCWCSMHSGKQEGCVSKQRENPTGFLFPFALLLGPGVSLWSPFAVLLVSFLSVGFLVVFLTPSKTGRAAGPFGLHLIFPFLWFFCRSGGACCSALWFQGQTGLWS